MLSYVTKTFSFFTVNHLIKLQHYNSSLYPILCQSKHNDSIIMIVCHETLISQDGKFDRHIYEECIHNFMIIGWDTIMLDFLKCKEEIFCQLVLLPYVKQVV
jgi:hypothetical protein